MHIIMCILYSVRRNRVPIYDKLHHVVKYEMLIFIVILNCTRIILVYNIVHYNIINSKIFDKPTFKPVVI